MILKCIKTALTTDGHDVATVAAGDLALKLLGSMPFDIIITDFAMPRMDGLEFLNLAQERCPEVPVIMITGYGTADTAMEAMAKGAFDYLPKPFSLDDLRATVVAANEYVGATRNASHLTEAKPDAFPFPNVVAASAAMAEVCKELKAAAKSLAPVLLKGEPGTGKRLLAQTIHANSPRKAGRFVQVDCRNPPQGTSVRQVLAETADGTVFFKEIGAMPMGMQTELAGIVEVQSFRKEQDQGPSSAQGRLIASTSASLEPLADSAKFRHDLFHKLKANTISIPPLRQRHEDIRVHIGRVLQQCRAGTKNMAPIGPDALMILEHHPWPGNVTELEEVTRNACVMAGGGRITASDLPPEVVHEATRSGAADGKGPKDLSQFRGRIVKGFLEGREEEYKNLISKIEGFTS